MQSLGEQWCIERKHDSTRVVVMVIRFSKYRQFIWFEVVLLYSILVFKPPLHLPLTVSLLNKLKIREASDASVLAKHSTLAVHVSFDHMCCAPLVIWPVDELILYHQV